MRRYRLALAAPLALALAACDSGGPAGPDAPEETIATLTADASAGWAFVDLGEPARAVAVADPGTSAAWDIAFNATGVMLNGGGDGPGGVVGYCVCQNQAATDEQVLAMTAEGELADFTAVRAGQVPAAGDAGWSAEVFETKKWYRYNLTGSHQVHPTYEVYLVKRGSEVYRIQLIGYYGPAGETRRITVRYGRLSS